MPGTMDGDGRITRTPTQAMGHGLAFDGGKGAKAVQAAPLGENATQHSTQNVPTRLRLCVFKSK